MSAHFVRQRVGFGSTPCKLQPQEASDWIEIVSSGQILLVVHPLRMWIHHVCCGVRLQRWLGHVRVNVCVCTSTLKRPCVYTCTYIHLFPSIPNQDRDATQKNPGRLYSFLFILDFFFFFALLFSFFLRQIRIAHSASGNWMLIFTFSGNRDF